VPAQSDRHSGRSILPYVGFMGLFAILLALVSRWYLLPAMDAFNHAQPDQRRLLALHALLLMTLLLVILGIFLILTYRLGRTLLRPPQAPRKPTPHVDAWTEAGRRFKEKNDEESE
jgi:heme/copper-type cytochrome/quinol oxidase subunit 2